MKPLNAERVETMIVDAMQAGDWITVDNLRPDLDRLTAPKPPVSTVSAALYYASIGLRVFPLQPGQKIPHKGTRGCLEATNDPAQITAWWHKWPDSNVAIATGHLVDVIDIDGPEGVISWARMGNLPTPLGVVSTPRAGGSHLYVPATGEGNAAKIFPGIDYRGAGGYVVAPTSINAEGVRYRWRRPLQLPAEEVTG
jgi:hypothetical protein